MIDGSQWEDLIKNNLPFLERLEFYTSLSHGDLELDTGIWKLSLDEMIAPFCTSFWTEEKRWLVICNDFLTSERFEMYTSPICMSSYSHVSDPKTMTISNFERGGQHSTMLESVDQLNLSLYEIIVGERVSELRNGWRS